MSLRPIIVISILALIASLANVASAQSNAAILRGTATDQAGAVLQGATVRLTNTIAGYVQTVRTDAKGAYELVDVPVNRYTLSVEATGFERAERDVVVDSNIVQHIDVQLGVAPIASQATVTDTGLLTPDQTAPRVVIDSSFVRDWPATQLSRSTEEIIATAPGWTLDANSRLHARGLEYQVQYSIDGVPVTDTVASTFAGSPDPRTFRSAEVATANIPAEYGDKLGGIVDVTTKSGLELEPSGSLTVSGGTFATGEVAGEAGGHIGKWGYFVSGAWSTTDRFLAPPDPENFHNRGTSGKGFLKLDYAPSDNNLFRFSISGESEHFQVPNLEEAQEEGTDQNRETSDIMETLSWQHVFSPNAVSYVALYHRYNAANLTSNDLIGPIFSEQSRHHTNYGVLGSLTYEKGRHSLKMGGEFKRFPLTESFTLAFTDFEEIEMEEPDIPEDLEEFTLTDPFFFREHDTGWEGSAYLQDHIRAGNFAFDLGLRFDSYHFLVEDNSVSPRVGMSYFIPKTRTVLRGSYNRLVETPALENLLLSSSDESRIFSPGEEEEGEEGDGGEEGRHGFRRGGDEGEEPAGDELTGAPVRVSHEHQFDIGFQQQIGDYLRADVDFYYRRLEDPPDIARFLETGIIFPTTLDRSRSKGIETRLDLAPVRGFSAFVSYTNMHIYGYGPVTGGLFLGEAIEIRNRDNKRINIEEDQRNTVVFQARYDYAPWKIWLALNGRHDSGFSVELEPDKMGEDFEERFDERVLEQVNLEQGFVKPHTTLDFSIGKEIPIDDHLSVSAQFNIRNLTNEFYLYTFEGISSGTTIGTPRTYAGRVTFRFN